MTTLLAYQTRMLDALRFGNWAAVSSSFAGERDRRNLGFRVYANNWMHALISALGDTFPAVRGALGEEAFVPIAVGYVGANPLARDELLMWYGSSFPGALAATSIAGAPYLADLARLEYAWLEAYHAPEASPLPPAALAALTPAQLVGARVHLHPSLRLLRSDHAVERVWQHYRSGGTRDTVPPAEGPACLAVFRPFAEVIAVRIPEPVHTALVRLATGTRFGDASRDLVRADHLEELRALIAAGLFTKIETQPEGGSDQ